MTVEKFDFADFFDPEKGKVMAVDSLEHKRQGIGAISIITPTQAITRWCGTLKDIEGKDQRGLDYHNDMGKLIQNQIIGTDIQYADIDASYVCINYANDGCFKMYITLPPKIYESQASALKFLLSKIRSSDISGAIKLLISERTNLEKEQKFDLMDDEEYNQIADLIDTKISYTLPSPRLEYQIIRNVDNSYQEWLNSQKNGRKPR